MGESENVLTLLRAKLLENITNSVFSSDSQREFYQEGYYELDIEGLKMATRDMEERIKIGSNGPVISKLKLQGLSPAVIVQQPDIQE